MRLRCIRDSFLPEEEKKFGYDDPESVTVLEIGCHYEGQILVEPVDPQAIFVCYDADRTWRIYPLNMFEPLA